jgi:hypothetical protein
MDLVRVQLPCHCTIQGKASTQHQWLCWLLACCGSCGALLLGVAAAGSCAAAVAVCCVNAGHILLTITLL